LRLFGKNRLIRPSRFLKDGLQGLFFPHLLFLNLFLQIVEKQVQLLLQMFPLSLSQP